MPECPGLKGGAAGGAPGSGSGASALGAQRPRGGAGAPGVPAPGPLVVSSYCTSGESSVGRGVRRRPQRHTGSIHSWARAPYCEAGEAARERRAAGWRPRAPAVMRGAGGGGRCARGAEAWGCSSVESSRTALQALRRNGFWLRSFDGQRGAVCGPVPRGWRSKGLDGA